ncbi:UNVERIFIED_CONTAM: hypothetical protein Sradi_6685700 [Sesamum radiatum]|uniref:Uncharacterized protein n=1 Tax=Sesamum radiatum TaxID=300843 RepID=A0AAW2JRL3_SESRA
MENSRRCSQWEHKQRRRGAAERKVVQGAAQKEEAVGARTLALENSDASRGAMRQSRGAEEGGVSRGEAGRGEIDVNG